MINGIHYLRAIAAMMVVGHHAMGFFPSHDGWSEFGAAGVDVFFVISGFVMALTTKNSAATASPSNTASLFVIKRLIRVVPMYWLALLWNLKRQIFERTIEVGVILDFFFLPRFNEVYENHIYPALPPGWTINYEMFFYAIFAIAILFRGYKYAAIFVALMSIVLLGHLVDFSSAFGQFYTSSIMLEFLYGILIYQATQKIKQDRMQLFAWPLLIAGFALMFIFSDTDVQRAYAAGPCAALIVYAGTLIQGRRKIKLLTLLADASFSIYITHQFTFGISRKLISGLNPDQPEPATIFLALAVQMVVAAAVGMLVHRWIEKPLTRWLNQHFANSRYSVHLGEMPAKRLSS